LMYGGLSISIYLEPLHPGVGPDYTAFIPIKHTYEKRQFEETIKGLRTILKKIKEKKQ
jgi:hypothetical protein